MTLQDCKKEVLSYTDCDSWDELISSGLNTVDRTIDLVAERYAQSELSEANKKIEEMHRWFIINDQDLKESRKEIELLKADQYHDQNVLEERAKEIERLKEDVKSRTSERDDWCYSYSEERKLVLVKTKTIASQQQEIERLKELLTELDEQTTMGGMHINAYGEMHKRIRSLITPK